MSAVLRKVVSVITVIPFLLIGCSVTVIEFR